MYYDKVIFKHDEKVVAVWSRKLFFGVVLFFGMFGYVAGICVGVLLS